MGGKIFVINGPSGVGKGTLVNRLLSDYPDLVIPNSYTTRPERPNEGTRKKYHFVSRDDFMKAVDEGKILEHEEVFGNLYGTDKESIERAMAEHKTIIAEVEPKGAQTYKQIFGEKSVLIFIAPPSIESLKNRIMHDSKRGSVSPEDLQNRLARADEELTYAPKCDVTIVNEDDQLDLAYQKLVAIIKS